MDWIKEVTGLTSPFDDEEPTGLTDSKNQNVCRHIDPDYEEKQEQELIDAVAHEEPVGPVWPPPVLRDIQAEIDNSGLSWNTDCSFSGKHRGYYTWKERRDMYTNWRGFVRWKYPDTERKSTNNN